MTKTNCTAICGDGKVAGPTDPCDDGNILDGLNCKNDCSGPLNGYVCSGGNFTSPTTCTFTCGDGIKTHLEACDDGSDNDIGCASGCLSVNPLYSCTYQTSILPHSTCKFICKDGFVADGEVCDDKGLGGCNSTCMGANPGYSCLGGDTISPTICTEICGDGIKTPS